ncbi:MAG: insulinase family protein [Prochloraceae cyanobacterium]|nr:insulinase family protein [Prochloraceae cyanobacterium]
MAIALNNSLQPERELAGFKVKAVVTLKDVEMVAYEIEHLATGAKLLHLHNDDAEKLFSIAFPTPPPDNTGIPHILEHSILGGSEKYPLRDIIFEMLKMSPATLINAVTSDDFTCYPISSKIEPDFFNLADVYFDAVFHPLLTENTFKREGHHLAPESLDDPNSALKVNGIVYNEMKGAFSDPNTIINNLVNRFLLPDTIYAKESGGIPEFIPDLTYKDFREFHRTYYHPSNAHFLCYGNINTEDLLEFIGPKLDGFEKQEISPQFLHQPRWSEPRTIEAYYPIGEQESAAEKTYLLVNWLLGDSCDVEETIALYILNNILLGNEAAPLKKAIIDAKLGQDLTANSGFNSVGRETIFTLGIKGSEADRSDRFLDLVKSTLEQIAAAEIEPSLVEAAFQQATYYYQEISRFYLFRLIWRVVPNWIYQNQPLKFLNLSEYVGKCQEKYAEDPKFFNRLIEAKFLNNSHRLTLIVKPDPNLQKKRDEALKQRLEEIRSNLSATQLSKIAIEARVLEQESSQGNPPELAAKLPRLTIKDLPSSLESISTTIDCLDNKVQLLRNQVFSNGINYLQLDFSLQGLPKDLWIYLPMYLEALQKSGAEKMNYEEIASGIASTTGGLKFECKFQTSALDPNKSLVSLRVSLKALDDRIEEALNLLQKILLGTNPGSDRQRLQNTVVQTNAKYRNNIVYRGLNTAKLRAEASFTPEAYLQELVNGLPQLKFSQQLVQDFDGLSDNLIAKIESIRNFVSSQPLTASFTGSNLAYQKVRTILSRWQNSETSSQILETDFTPSIGLREGLAAPVQVAYCAQTYLAPHFSEPLSAHLFLGKRLVSLDYLINEIRLKGGAYGANCSYNPLGQNLTFSSYRDPQIAPTLKVFDRTAEYLQNVDWRQEDIERTIISSTQEYSPVLRPERATSLALDRYLTGQSEQIRQQRYENSLQATVKDVKEAFLKVLEQGKDRVAVCVLSSREKLESANSQISKPLSIQDIIDQ